MPDARGPGRGVHLLSRLLPREFRERVFEPALADLLLDEETTRRGRWPRLLLVAECARIGLPQHLWRRRRPTRLGLALGLIALVVALGVSRRRYAARWEAESQQVRAP
jgi:hypothetical protein